MTDPAGSVFISSPLSTCLDRGAKMRFWMVLTSHPDGTSVAPGGAESRPEVLISYPLLAHDDSDDEADRRTHLMEFDGWDQIEGIHYEPVDH